MVIANSDSNGTLVSLNYNGLKRVGSLELLRASPVTQRYEFYPTDILLPEDEFFEDYDDGESFYSCTTDEFMSKESNVVMQRDRLYLPTSGNANVDECLKCLPSVMERCDDLLSQAPKRFTDKSRTRVLYVGQQEVAHAVPLQCDVMMSDKATTCHVLAMRSVSTPSVVPLVSVTHIDGTKYEDCIRAMVQRHLCHHQMDDSLLDEEKKDNGGNDEYDDERMELDLHIMGGFNDRDGTSRKISNWLFSLLADIASEERDYMITNLRTCAISFMNDDGQGAPIGRGLGICTRTGDVFLASCDESAAGPDGILRSIRLWSRDRSDRHLEVIHEETSNMIKVSPFRFRPFPELQHMLTLPDHELLKCTSTSPECEEEDFCPRLRQAFVYLRDVRCETIFGPKLDRTRYFKRLGFSNVWKGLHS